MLKKIILLLVSCIFLGVSNAAAARLDVYTDGLELLPKGIWTSQIVFGIDGEWTFEYSKNFDTASINWPVAGVNSKTPYSILSMSIPGFGDIYEDKWGKEANKPTNDRLVIAINDGTFGDFPLGNGLLFSLTYPETVTLSLDLAYTEFVNDDGLVNLVPSAQTFGAGNNTLIFATPIPSSLLLLGGGILALAGIRRRKISV